MPWGGGAAGSPEADHRRGTDQVNGSGSGPAPERAAVVAVVFHLGSRYAVRLSLARSRYGSGPPGRADALGEVAAGPSEADHRRGV